MSDHIDKMCLEIEALRQQLSAERAISDKLENALRYAEDSLGSFCSDEGWGANDMDNWDNAMAVLAELASMRKGETE